MSDKNPATTEELIEFLRADFEFHQYLSSFSIEKLLSCSQWLREAALRVLEEDGFYGQLPSASESPTEAEK
jgi:hypothetical protein